MRFRHWLGERSVDFDELDPPLRRVVMLAYATLIGIALAIAFRDHFAGPTLVVQAGLVIHSYTIWPACIGIMVAMTLILAGVAHATSRWRYLLAVPIALAMMSLTVMASEGIWQVWVFWLLLFLPVPILGAMLWIGPRLRTRYILGVSALLVLGFLAIAVGTSLIHGQLAGPTALVLLMFLAARFLGPALLVVGWDLATLAEPAIAHSIEDLFARAGRVRARSLAGAACLTATGAVVALGWYDDHGFRFVETLAEILVMLAAGVGAAVLIVRRIKATHADELPAYRHTLLIAACLCLASGLATYVRGADPDLFVYKGPHPFVVQLPHGYTQDRQYMYYEQRNSALNRYSYLPRMSFRFASRRGLPVFDIFGYLRPPFAALSTTPSSVDDVVENFEFSDSKPKSKSDYYLPPLTPLRLSGPDDLGWRHNAPIVFRYRGHVFTARIYEREEPAPDQMTDMNWFLVCRYQASKPVTSTTTCDDVRSGFHAALYARPPSAIAIYLLDIALWTVAFACLLVAGAARWAAHRSTFLFAGCATLLCATLCTADLLEGNLSVVLFYDVQFAGALLVALLVVFLVVAAVARLWQRRPSFSLDWESVCQMAMRQAGVVIILEILYLLYVFAIDSSDSSRLVHAVLICAALTWELVTAGELMNQSHEPRVFPRASRVLIFSGYLILVATCVFFVNDIHVQTGLQTDNFDSESWVAFGLVILGGGWALSRLLSVVSSPAAEA